MEEEKREMESSGEMESGEERADTLTLKKSHLLTIVGVIVMVSFFVLAAQAMIANAGSTPVASATGNVVSNGNAGTQAAAVQDGKQTVQLSMQNGNYYPNIIRVKKGIPVELQADMNSVKGCYRGIQIPAFGVRKTVTASDNKITFTPDKAGTFGFSCFMGMGTGQIVVEDEAGNVPNINTVSQDIPTGHTCGSSGGGCGCGG